MRVVCDQCASTYKVPNAKLTKPINKATCRNCGARLMIPKPQPGADEDERVVALAVPQTASLGAQGVVAPAAEDDSDKTMPVVRKPKPKPAALATPPEEDDVGLDADAGEATLTMKRSDIEAVQAAAAGVSGRRAVKSAFPEPKVEAPAARPAAAPAAPRPAPASATAPAAGGGLMVALVGAAAGLLGVALLGLSSAIPTLTLPGLFLGGSGAATALLVLAIGNLGTRDGMGIVSLLGGVVVGVVMCLLPMVPVGAPGPEAPRVAAAPVAPPAGDVAATTDVPAADAPEAAAPVADPPADDEPAKAAASSAAEPPARAAAREPDRAPARTAAGAAREPEPVPAREPAPAPRAEPTRAAPPPASTSGSRVPSTERDRIEPEPTRAPPPLPPARTAPAPAPSTTAAPTAGNADGLMPNVPPSVIQTIVKTNQGVKQCFYEGLKSGEVKKPITVATTFNLAASGSASNLRVNNPELRGSTLERCLDAAFRSMSFPAAAKGGPVNFPFVLN